MSIRSNMDGQDRWQAALMNNYGTPSITLVRGRGAHVWDAEGNKYLDLVGGIAVNALGHAHPEITRTVTEQINTLAHVSNLYAHPVAIELAESLRDITGLPGSKVLFVNSGAEANEAALKISRLTGRTKIVACQGAFHGRTMGALSLTGQASKKEAFEPLVPEVVHVPFGDAAAMRAAVDDQTAAVFVEPILGEGGVIPAPEGFLAEVREITANTGTLLVLDEVQTGIGRTGEWFAFQRADITPDLVTVAKGFGGGLPLGAVIGVGEVGELMHPGQHGTTFGGNPVCCAAGLAVLRAITKDGLLGHVKDTGEQLAAGIAALNHPLVAEVRGAGLLIGIALTKPVAAHVAETAGHRGFLVNPVASNVIRLAPPLVLTKAEAKEFVEALPAILDKAEER